MQIGGGLRVDSAGGTSFFFLKNSIVANNSAPTEPDISQAGNGINTILEGQNLINDNSGSGIAPAAGFIGTAAAPIDPKLTPLADYGGSTQTILPLPGSPAINNAADSTRSIDQRGFAITDGSPDIGAVEFRGSLDLEPLFDIDFDGDGSSFAVEFALGTDPFLPDPQSEFNPAIFPNFLESDQIFVGFGANPDAIGILTWVLERSTDLTTFTEIYRSSNPDVENEINPPRPGIVAGPFGSAVRIRDDETTSSRNFYRFRAELRN